MSLSSCCAALAIYATERRKHGSPSTDNCGKKRVDESSASMDIIARIKGMAFTVRMKEHDLNGYNCKNCRGCRWLCRRGDHGCGTTRNFIRPLLAKQFRVNLFGPIVLLCGHRAQQAA